LEIAVALICLAWLGTLLIALDPQIGISIGRWLRYEEEQEPEPEDDQKPDRLDRYV